MSIAELLKPRWKVISSFPGGEWLKIGEILVLRDLGEYVDAWDSLLPENYPAIFQPLKWWEERNIEDLPEYIKNVDGVYKLLGRAGGSKEMMRWMVVPNFPEYGEEFSYILDNRMEPATKEDYDIFINNQNK